MGQEKRADIILVLTTIVAAAGWIFSKEAIQGLPPAGFIGIRFLLASLCLLPFCYRSIAKASRKDMTKAAGVGGILGTALLLWIFAISVSDTLAEGAFIMSLSMLFAPLLAWPIFGLKPGKRFWLSMPIAVSGLALLSLSGGWHQSSSQLLFMLAAFSLGLHFNFNARYASRIPTLLLTCIQLAVTGAMGILFSLLFESWPTHIPVEIWGWLSLSVLLATSLRYVLQTTGQKHSSLANAAIIMVLEPVWTVLMSMVWYGEELPLPKLVGCVMILFALLTYRGLFSVLRFKKTVS